MFLLVILYIYIYYRWTKRVTRRTDFRPTKLSFITIVCLKMSWRLLLMSVVFVLLVAGGTAMQAMPSRVEAASQHGTEQGLAFVIIGLPVTLLMSILVPLNSFRRRLPPVAEIETPPNPAGRDNPTMDVARSLDSYESQAGCKPPVQGSLMPTATQPESASSLEKELRTLAALKADGIITEEEFAAKKRALLGI